MLAAKQNLDNIRFWKGKRMWFKNICWKALNNAKQSWKIANCGALQHEIILVIWSLFCRTTCRPLNFVNAPIFVARPSKEKLQPNENQQYADAGEESQDVRVDHGTSEAGPDELPRSRQLTSPKKTRYTRGYEPYASKVRTASNWQKKSLWYHVLLMHGIVRILQASTVAVWKQTATVQEQDLYNSCTWTRDFVAAMPITVISLLLNTSQY